MLFIIREAMTGLWRHRLMSTISLGVIFFSLLILGIFLLGTFNLFAIIKVAEQKVEITAYLEDDLSEGELKTLQNNISNLSGVKKVVFVSKNEALNKFRKELTQAKDLLNMLEINPLPSSFQVKLDEGYKSPETVKEIAHKVSLFNGVEDAIYGEEWVKRLSKIINFLFIFDIFLGIVISLASIFIVSNTIRLTVIARKDSIEIMDLVGATNEMITAPFMLEGIIQGAVGGLFTSYILYEIYRLVHLKFFTFYFPGRPLILGITVFGMILGYIGSGISVKKYIYGGNQ